MVDETRTPEQLQRTAVAFGNDLLVIQSPGGPVQAIELARLIGRLGPVDLVVAEFADLTVDHDAGTLAIVYADPDPSFLGYFVKFGANGTGGWIYSDVFRGFSGVDGTDGNDGAPGAAGTKYRFGGSIEGDVPGPGDVLLRHVFNHAVSYPVGFAGSYARLRPGGAPPAIDQVFRILVEDQLVGTLTFEATGLVSFVTLGDGFTCAIGEEFRLEANDLPVSQLVGASFTFAGIESGPGVGV